MSSFSSIYTIIKEKQYINIDSEKIKIKKNNSSENLLKKNNSSENLLRTSSSIDNFMKLEWPWLV